MSVKPVWIRAPIPPEQVIFNHDLAFGLMWPEGAPILQVIETYNNFQNATILRGKCAIDVWQAFMEYWVTIYSGYPNIIKLGQESELTATNFKDLATVDGIQLQLSGAQSHNSMGSEEK